MRDFEINGSQLAVATSALAYTGITCTQCGVSDLSHLQFYEVGMALNLPYWKDAHATDIYIQYCGLACATIGGGTINASGAQKADIDSLIDWSVFSYNATSDLVLDSGAGEIRIDHLTAGAGTKGVVLQNTSSSGHKPEHIIFDDRTNIDADATCNFCVYSAWDVELNGVESASTTSGPSILVSAAANNADVDGVDIVGSTVRGAFTDDIQVVAGADINLVGDLIYAASSAAGASTNTGAAVHLEAGTIGAATIVGNMMKGNEQYANLTSTQGYGLLVDSGALASSSAGGHSWTGTLLVAANDMSGNAVAAIQNNSSSIANLQIDPDNVGDTTTIAPARLPLATSSAFGAVKVDGSTITASSGIITAGLAVGTTAIASGTNGDIEYNNADVLGELATTGSGNVVRATSPTTTTPKLTGYTVSTLPVSPGTSARAYVSDATTCTFLGALTGSGSTFCPVIYNGSAWVAD